MKKRLSALSIVLAAALASVSPLGATTHENAASRAKHHALADGEIRKVDKEMKKITIRHGPIANLDMPPMTMVFQVHDPAMVDRVKPGDKVRFAADKIGGAYTITELEPVQ